MNVEFDDMGKEVNNWGKELRECFHDRPRSEWRATITVSWLIKVGNSCSTNNIAIRVLDLCQSSQSKKCWQENYALSTYKKVLQCLTLDKLVC